MMRGYVRNADNQGFRLAALGALLAAVFVADTVTSYEIAAAVFYVAAILVAVPMLSRRGVMGLAIFCISLTVVSFTLSRFGEHDAGKINLVISISAIATTAFLALRIVDAETAAHEARAHLGRLARMTSLGALTGSIAHEVNQPLAAIAASGNAGLRWLSQESPRPEKAEAALRRIVADANRASTIIGNLRKLARGAPPEQVPVDVTLVVQETLDLARREIEHKQAKVHLDLREGLRVLADPTQIQQVVGNLLLNAVEAIENAEERQIAISSEIVRGEAVVTVADTGPGFPTLEREKLFGAFWTTKPSGTGMGLTICQSIIEAHGGSIWVAPHRSTGARVAFSLPLLQAPAA